MGRKNLIILILVFFLFFTHIFAQPEYPRVSPKASITQRVGITDITVTYCRPGVKGRLVWGELVPLGKVWRAGANEATTITFSHAVTISGTKVPAGKYSFFILPEETNDATIILNKNPDLFGTSGYKKEEDVLRLKVKPIYLEHEEWLSYNFEELTKNSAILRMHWEDFGVQFKIDVDTDKYVLEGAEKAKGWEELYDAANYCLQNNVELDQGKAWLEKSLGEEKNYWNMSLKARYLALDGQYDGARQVMEDALIMGKNLDRRPFNYQEMESLLKEWKNQ
jgi:hypothetical protein